MHRAEGGKQPPWMGSRHCMAGWHRSRHWNPTFLTVWESLSFDVIAASGVTGVGDVTGSRRGRQHLVVFPAAETRHWSESYASGSPWPLSWHSRLRSRLRAVSVSDGQRLRQAKRWPASSRWWGRSCYCCYRQQRYSTRQSRGSSARGGSQASMPGWGASSR